MLSSFQLHGKVAFVTGGTSGLGLAIAQALASAGARIVVGSSNASKVDEAVKALGGAPHAGVVMDLTNPPSIDAAFEELSRITEGKLDILVNAAGIISRCKAESESLENWKRVMDVNVTGAFLCSQKAFKMFNKPEAGASVSGTTGVILNICSIASSVALSDVTAYATSKGGLAMMTKCVARQ